MLTESDIASQPTRRTHRTYSRQFKAEMVFACKRPGVSIAALALSHSMNVNVLHRWLREHERGGLHQLAKPGSAGGPVAISQASEFIPLKLPSAIDEPVASTLKVELRKGCLSMLVSWPLSAAADFTQWSTALLK